MSKSLKIAETKNEIIKDEDVNNKIWFTQHFSLIMNIFINSKVVDYTGSQDYLVDQILVFCLRGIGFKEKAIDKYYNKEKINKMLARYNLSI